jgi:uncharacterized protein YndB with AHSA1/START domain
MSAGEVGRTRDAGWQIGVSMTVDHPIERVWAFLTSSEGTAVWLGHGVEVLQEKGRPYETTEGTVGETRSVRPRDRIRLTWQPKGWDHDSTVQVAVTPNGPGRTILRFHQERLTSAHEREQQRAHWQAVLTSVAQAIDAGEGRPPTWDAGR